MYLHGLIRKTLPDALGFHFVDVLVSFHGGSYLPEYEGVV